MFKHVVLVGSILLAGCGSSSSGEAPGGPGGGDQPVGTVGLPLAAGTNKVKAVLKGSVKVPVQINDEITNTPISVTCSTDADCTAYGATCVTNICVADQFAIMYVKNIAPTDTVKVPCITGNYRIEAYASPQSTSPFDISNVYNLNFSMTGCTANYATADWNAPSVAPTYPSLAFPSPIYVTSFRPTFSVQLTGGVYPWTTQGWTLGDPTAPTAYNGAVAVFDAPAAATPLSFTGFVQLDRSLLLGAETWRSAVGAANQPVVDVAPVALP